MEKCVFVLTFILCAVITLNLASFIHSACAMICAAEIILAKCIFFFSSGIAWNKMNELQTSLFAFSLMVCFVLFLFLFWLFKKTMLSKVLWLLKRFDGATFPTRQQGKRILSANIIHVSRDCILEEQQEIFQEILWWLTARMAVGSGPVVTQPAQEPSYSLRLLENCIVSASGECDWSLNKNININFAPSY